MVVRPGQYVGGEGRVYHPYLAEWQGDRSNVSEFFSILQKVFSREPPLVAKQEVERTNVQTRASPLVPPLPPKPGTNDNARPPLSPTQQQAPPPPPKEFNDTVRNQHTGNRPPLPLPPMNSVLQHGSLQSRYGNEHVRDTGSMARPALPEKRPEQDNSPGGGGENPQFRQMNPMQLYQQPSNPVRAGPSHYTQDTYPSRAGNPAQYQHPQQALGQLRENHTGAIQPSPYQSANHQFAPPPNQHPLTTPHRQQRYQQQLRPPPKPKPPEDLLTSPFEAALPPQPTNVAPPPIPPNPQKDALLSALSQTLTQQVRSAHDSNLSALPPLRAQQAAMTSTLNAINAEMSQLNDLEALLSSNEAILHQAMQDADKVLEDAKRRKVPNIDDVLVAPTVVAEQLYQLIAEERAIEESRGVLGKALDKGRIGSGLWAKQVRSLAREEFLKKALIKKISRGMGLTDMETYR
ncbi:Suppressor protein stp22 of temperature-sensitive alpha-factor receptor and arginine permease [Lecanora helva]